MDKRILHILWDGPSPTAEAFISAQRGGGHTVTVIDLSASPSPDYAALVREIMGHDSLMTW